MISCKTTMNLTRGAKLSQMAIIPTQKLSLLYRKFGDGEKELSDDYSAREHKSANQLRALKPSPAIILLPCLRPLDATHTMYSKRNTLSGMCLPASLDYHPEQHMCTILTLLSPWTALHLWSICAMASDWRTVPMARHTITAAPKAKGRGCVSLQQQRRVYV